MRLEWLDDILAVAECGSFQAAAERRRLTQAAFSRRVRTIEDSIGVVLFDRSARPARLSPHALEQVERMRELSIGLRDLTAALQDNDRRRRKRLVIAAQHAIAASSTPAVVASLSELDFDIRLRSANRDECLAQMMTNQTDLALIYDLEGETPVAGWEFFDVVPIGKEALVPVFAAEMLPALNAAFAKGELPVIAYPKDVYLGSLQSRLIFPKLTSVGRIRPRLETALTLAALQFARTGLGVAWIPRNLASGDIRLGTLIDLSATLPVLELRLIAARLKRSGSTTTSAAWGKLVETAKAATLSQPASV
jgi:LysR family transcriptional regulator, hypochlorite-specific transcription factor HypT